MKKLMQTVFFLAVGFYCFAGEKMQSLAPGVLIGRNIQRLNEVYGEQIPHVKTSSDSFVRTEFLRWSVNGGYLEIEVSPGAGIIQKILYVIEGKNDSEKIIINIKSIDIESSEMVIDFTGIIDRKRIEIPEVNSP